MGLIQKLVLALIPRQATEIEQESKSWVLTCPHCGHVHSVWELGGVRYKAHSVGKRTGVRCAQCRRFSMMPMERKE
jgi:predicted RNA-binding Zn-ribbon protein involved in translation (DUF1610 family)